MSQFSGNTVQSVYAAHRWNYPTVQENRGRGHVRYTQAQKDEALSLLDKAYSPRDIFRKLGIPEQTIYNWKRGR